MWSRNLPYVRLILQGEGGPNTVKSFIYVRIHKLEYSCDGEDYQPVLPGKFSQIEKKCDHRHDGQPQGQHKGECEITPQEFFNVQKCLGR